MIDPSFHRDEPLAHDRRQKRGRGRNAATRGPLPVGPMMAAILAAAGGVASPLAAADVNVTTNTGTGVNLDAASGSTALVQSGVTVSNGLAAVPVSASTSAWALTNQGTIAANLANSVSLSFAGSSVTNAGAISGGGIYLTGGGSVDNQTGATLTSPLSAIVIGTTSAGAGTVTNSGAITQTGTASDLVLLRFGGTVTNNAGATISANNRSNAVSVGQGTARSVLNSGTISNTGTGFATGVLMQGGPSTLTNTATGHISGTFNGVYTSSSGVLTFTNNGLIESTGASASARAVEATGGGSFINTGTITSASSDGLYLARAGTVTNTGTIKGAVRAINFSGNYARTLTLGTGSVLTGIVQGGIGSDGLILQGTGSEDISKFLAFETLAMQGSAWTLTGNGIFATQTTVETGTLTVAGSLTSPVTVNSGAVLRLDGTIKGTSLVASGGRAQGTGTYGATTVAAGGTLAPGAVARDLATLSVSGPLSFASGSLLEVDVTAAGAHDLVSGSGGTTLSGGTVAVQAAAGSYAPSTQYTILTDSGGLTGTFASATSTLAFLSPVLSYTGTDVILTLNRNGLDFGSVGGSFNQRATGAAVQPLGSGNPVFDAVVVLDVPGAQAAFDQLSGEVHASIRTAFLEDSALIRTAMLNRLRGAGPAAGFAFWAQGIGAQGRWPGDGNAARLERDQGGLVLGVDGMLDDGWRVGLAGGLGHTSFGLDARNASASSSDRSVGFYAGKGWGALALRGGAALTWHDVSTLRAPGFAGFSDRLNAGYTARTRQAFVEMGYQLDQTATKLEPFVNLAYVTLATSGFAEAGGAAALTGAASRQNALFGTLGLRGERSVTLGPGQTALVHGMMGLRLASGDMTPLSDLALAGGSGYVVAGVPLARSLGVIDLGLSVPLGAGGTLDLTYSGQFGSGGAAQNRLGIAYLARF